MDRAAGAMGKSGWHQPTTLPLMLLISMLLHGALAFYWPAYLSSASTSPGSPGADIHMQIQHAEALAQQPIQEAIAEPAVAIPEPAPEPELSPEPVEVSRLEPEPVRDDPEPQPVIEQQSQPMVKTKPEPLPKLETMTVKSLPKISRQPQVKPRSRPRRHPQKQPATEAPEAPEAPEAQPEVAETENPVKPTPAEPVQGPITAMAKSPASEPVIESQQQQATRLMIIDWIQKELKQHFSYPLQARRRGWQGTVMLEFTVASRGGITDIRISQSSGHRVLDRNAEETLQHIANSGMASVPFVGQSLSLAVPVSYRLR